MIGSFELYTSALSVFDVPGLVQHTRRAGAARCSSCRWLLCMLLAHASTIDVPRFVQQHMEVYCVDVSTYTNNSSCECLLYTGNKSTFGNANWYLNYRIDLYVVYIIALLKVQAKYHNVIGLYHWKLAV